MSVGQCVSTICRLKLHLVFFLACLMSTHAYADETEANDFGSERHREVSYNVANDSFSTTGIQLQLGIGGGFFGFNDFMGGGQLSFSIGYRWNWIGVMFDLDYNIFGVAPGMPEDGGWDGQYTFALFMGKTVERVEVWTKMGIGGRVWTYGIPWCLKLGFGVSYRLTEKTSLGGDLSGYLFPYWTSNIFGGGAVLSFHVRFHL